MATKKRTTPHKREPLEILSRPWKEDVTSEFIEVTSKQTGQTMSSRLGKKGGYDIRLTWTMDDDTELEATFSDLWIAKHAAQDGLLLENYTATRKASAGTVSAVRIASNRKAPKTKALLRTTFSTKKVAGGAA